MKTQQHNSIFLFHLHTLSSCQIIAHFYRPFHFSAQVHQTLFTCVWSGPLRLKEAGQSILSDLSTLDFTQIITMAVKMLSQLLTLGLFFYSTEPLVVCNKTLINPDYSLIQLHNSILQYTEVVDHLYVEYNLLLKFSRRKTGYNLLLESFIKFEKECKSVQPFGHTVNDFRCFSSIITVFSSLLHTLGAVYYWKCAVIKVFYVKIDPVIATDHENQTNLHLQ